MLSLGRPNIKKNLSHPYISRLRRLLQQVSHVYLWASPSCQIRHVRHLFGLIVCPRSEGIEGNCKIEHRPSREKVYQLSPTDHLVYTPSPLTTQIQCRNDSYFPLKIKATSCISIPHGCSVELTHHSIHSDWDQTNSIKPLKEKGKFWKKIILPWHPRYEDDQEKYPDPPWTNYTFSFWIAWPQVGRRPFYVYLPSEKSYWWQISRGHKEVLFRVFGEFKTKKLWCLAKPTRLDTVYIAACWNRVRKNLEFQMKKCNYSEEQQHLADRHYAF